MLFLVKIFWFVGQVHGHSWVNCSNLLAGMRNVNAPAGGLIKLHAVDAAQLHWIRCTAGPRSPAGSSASGWGWKRWSSLFPLTDGLFLQTGVGFGNWSQSQLFFGYVIFKSCQFHVSFFFFFPRMRVATNGHERWHLGYVDSLFAHLSCFQRDDAS